MCFNIARAGLAVCASPGAGLRPGSDGSEDSDDNNDTVMAARTAASPGQGQSQHLAGLALKYPKQKPATAAGFHSRRICSRFWAHTKLYLPDDNRWQVPE